MAGFIRNNGVWVPAVTGGSGPAEPDPVPDITDLDPLDVGNVLGLAGYTAAFEEVYDEVVPYGSKVNQDPAAGATPGAGSLVTVRRSIGKQAIAWLYYSGGYSAEEVTNHHGRTFRVNLRALLAGDAPVWEEKTEAPNKRAFGFGGVAASAQPKVLVHAGGATNVTPAGVTSIDRYNAETDTWSSGTALNSNRRSGANAPTPEYLAMVGGYNGASSRDNHYARYYPTANTTFTSVMTGVPFTTAGPVSSAAVYLNGEFFMGGGVEAAITDRFGSYVPAGAYTARPVLPMVLQSHTFLTDGESVFSFGGYSGSIRGEVWKYTPGGAWVVVEPLPVATQQIEGEWFEEAGVFLLFGGLSSDVPNKRVWAYDPVANTYDLVGEIPVHTRAGVSGIIELAAA